jgi:hypothetical protein
LNYTYQLVIINCTVDRDKFDLSQSGGFAFYTAALPVPRKVQLERAIDLDTVAALTTGFTGADSSAAADRIMGKRRGRSVELSHSFLRNARAAMPICVPADLRRARVCIAL